MRNLFFSKFIFITFFVITTSSEFISFNLKYFKTTNPSTSYLYTILKLGDPESNIYTYISTKNPLFSMMKINKKLDENESLEYYNISSSRTFKNVSNLYVKLVTSEKDIYAQEKIKLNYYNNETKKYREISVNNIDFVMGISLSEITGQIYFMNIGFPVMISNTINDKFNFILQLKGKNIIKSYDWFILYNDIDLNENELLTFENIQNINATLIIGGLPHFYNSEKFFKSQILTEYSEIFAWTMKFKDVYLYIDDKITRKQKKISTNLDIVQIYLDDISIYAPSYFTNLIKREYFSRYVNCYFSKEGEYLNFLLLMI